MVKNSRKISKEIEDLKTNIHQPNCSFNPTGITETKKQNQNTSKCTLLASVHAVFTKTDHAPGHDTHTNKFQKIEIIEYVL